MIINGVKVKPISKELLENVDLTMETEKIKTSIYLSIIFKI